VKETLSTVLAHNQARGMQGRPLRLMVVGIPNVGKSSLINRLSRRSRAETADQPGVTRRNQWYRVGSVDGINIELLDTPGVLWPKFEDPIAGETLAFLGSIKSEVLDNESLSLRLLDVLLKEYPARLAERYRICTTGTTPPEALETLARRRGMLQSGGVPDTRRAACMLLDELQAGRLGTLTLDAPPRCNTGSLQE
jgi:ribosome biogenesis GTPase A